VCVFVCVRARVCPEHVVRVGRWAGCRLAASNG
jgi:hypothetical protein